MANEIAQAYIALTTKMPGVKKDITSALGGSDVQGAVSREGSKIGEKVLDGIATAFKTGALAVGAVAVGLIGTALVKGFGRLNALDQATAKLTGLGHSAESVDVIMTNALASVKGTAFGLDAAASAAANAVAAGVKPGVELERTLKLIADASSIAGVGMDQMGAIFNKVAASNKVQMDVINQLHDAGIPALALLADQMGVTAEKASEMASKGEIDFATFQAAMEKGLGGAALESGNTFQGAMDNVLASLGRVGANLLSGLFPEMTGGLQSLIDWLGPLEDKAKEVGAAFGDWIREWGPKIVDVLKGIWAAGVTVVNWLKQNREWLIALAAAAAAFLAVFAGFQMIRNITIAFKAFNATLTANPILLIVAAVAALVAGLTYFFTQTEVGRQAWSAFVGFLGEVWDGGVKFVTDIWETKLKPIFDGLIQIGAGVIEFFEGVFTGSWEKVWGGLGKIFGGIWDVIVASFQSFINFFIDGINTFIRGLNTIGDGLEAVGLGGFEIALITRLGEKKGGGGGGKMVALAEGGIVTSRPGGIVANIGEGRYDEAVIPLSPKVLSQLGGSSSSSSGVTLVLEGDSAAFMKWMNAYEQKADGQRRLIIQNGKKASYV